MSTARKPGLSRRLSLAAALLGVTAAPFALAIPAEAATTLQWCTVTPLAPVFAGVVGPPVVKKIRYNVVITCAPGRSVEVQQTFMEDDLVPDPDDFTGTRVDTYNPSGIVTKGHTELLGDTEVGPEEVYQKVRFRVTPTATGIQGPWTLFESSPTLTIAN